MFLIVPACLTLQSSRGAARRAIWLAAVALVNLPAFTVYNALLTATGGAHEVLLRAIISAPLAGCALFLWLLLDRTGPDA